MRKAGNLADIATTSIWRQDENLATIRNIASTRSLPLFLVYFRMGWLRGCGTRCAWTFRISLPGPAGRSALLWRGERPEAQSCDCLER